jgi:hypothetical protein
MVKYCNKYHTCQVHLHIHLHLHATRYIYMYGTHMGYNDASEVKLHLFIWDIRSYTSEVHLPLHKALLHLRCTEHRHLTPTMYRTSTPDTYDVQNIYT